MKFTTYLNKNVSFTATSLDKLPKVREEQFRLMLYFKAKEMQMPGTKLRIN